MTAGYNRWWLASPSTQETGISFVDGQYAFVNRACYVAYDGSSTLGVCPIVSIT